MVDSHRSTYELESSDSSHVEVGIREHNYMSSPTEPSGSNRGSVTSNLEFQVASLAIKHRDSQRFKHLPNCSLSLCSTSADVLLSRYVIPNL